MNTFVKNYWSLYVDFLEDFEKLNYKGFSLSYLFCHFYSVVINNNILLNQLYDENIGRMLKNQVKDRKEVQVKFNTFIQLHTKNPSKEKKQGKVVIHVDKLLRFPNKTFTAYFNPSNTIILNSGKNSKNKLKKNSATTIYGINNIPIEYLQHYAVDSGKAVKKMQNQARVLCKGYKKHLLYNDEQFQNMFLIQISHIINCIEEITNFLDRVSVSCIVVSTTHSYINRILALVAAKKGIPTVCIQHGIIANEFGYLPKVATIDAVYGDFEVDWYKKKGVPVESLEVTGHPRFDELFNRSTISRIKFNQQLSLDTNKKTLMVTVRENYDMDKWRVLIKTIINKYEMNIVIKDYPGKETNTLLKEFPFVHSTKNYQLYDILPNVDAVVTYPSTVGLEAMLADKPVFILDNADTANLNNRHERLSTTSSLINNPGYSDYYNALKGMVHHNPEKLGELIVKYFQDTKWECETKKKKDEFLNYVYPNFSLSGKRLKKLIDRLTSQYPKYR